MCSIQGSLRLRMGALIAMHYLKFHVVIHFTAYGVQSTLDDGQDHRQRMPSHRMTIGRRHRVGALDRSASTTCQTELEWLLPERSRSAW